MSEHKADGDPRALLDAPFASDAERAESEWLLRREEDPDASPPSSVLPHQHAELEELLRDLPMPDSDERWHDEVLRKVAAQPPSPEVHVLPRRWWAIAGAVAAVAVILAIVLLRHPDLRALEWEILDGGSKVRGSAAAVGQQLVVTARPDGAGDLRVYDDTGALVARCPAGPKCTSRAGDRTQTAEITLERAGVHHMILVVGVVTALPDAPLATYIAAARAAGGRIRHEQVEVR